MKESLRETIESIAENFPTSKFALHTAPKYLAALPNMSDAELLELNRELNFLLRGEVEMFKTKAKRLESHNEDLKKDDLTQLPTKKVLKGLSTGEINSKSVLMVIDLNGLKGINDNKKRLGPRIGDLFISTAGTTVKNCSIRGNSHDYRYRYGGDEFVLLLENCTVDDVMKKGGLGDRLNTEFKEKWDKLYDLGIVPIPSTYLGLAYGAAEIDGQKTLQDLYDEADAIAAETKYKARAVIKDELKDVLKDKLNPEDEKMDSRIIFSLAIEYQLSEIEKSSPSSTKKTTFHRRHDDKTWFSFLKSLFHKTDNQTGK